MKNSRLITYWILFLIITQGCSQFVTDKQEDDIRINDFNATWTVFDEWYPYFEYKNIDWDHLYDIYYPQVTASVSDEYLLVINKMLLELKDGHVEIRFKDGRGLCYSTPRQIKDKNKFNFSVTRKYVTSNMDSLMGSVLYYGFISDLAYLRVSTFSDPDPQTWASSINKIFTKFTDTRAMIIDVRHNPGGSTTNASQIISRCIEQPLSTPGWTEKGIYQEGPVFAPDEGNNFTNPIVVLVNGKSFSATEHFALWMQHIDYVKLIGDTTGGGAGNPFYKLLPSGNKVRVPTRCFYRYDGIPIEWNGIEPDYLVVQSDEEIQQGKDTQLEYAIKYLTNNTN